MIDYKTENVIVRDIFEPKKSSIIEKIEYSFWWKNGERYGELITIWFLPTVSFSYLCVEYQLGEDVYNALIAADSVAKYWYKNIKDIAQYKILKRK